MTIAKFIAMHKEIMYFLSKHEIKMDDFKYVDMYEDYESMKRKGVKVEYIVSLLCSKYSMSRASVYRVLRRFKVSI